ncbi:MAG: hypothetical protein LCI03_17390 [Actinobacteria bacterium]|nr:hypothetical protein [Actinomycetota bacterium]
MMELADDHEMTKRRQMADEFYGAVLADADRPWFVSDEASLYDIQAEDDDELVRRVRAAYGVTLRMPDDLRRPFWQLLDELQRLRS